LKKTSPVRNQRPRHTLKNRHRFERQERDLTEFAINATGLGISSILDDGTFYRTIEHDRIFGIDPNSKFDLNDLFESFHPDDRKGVADEIKAVLAGKKTGYDFEHRIVRKDGTIRWVHAFGKATSDPKLNRIRLTVGVMDTTDRKKLESDREMFIASLSHDLRNPLSAIRANAELLKRYPRGFKENQDTLGRIVFNVDRADRMIQNMLDLAHIRAGEKRNPVYKHCDLKKVISDSLKEATLRYGDRFEFISRGDFDGVWPDQEIQRMIDNLVENAVKYGCSDTAIQVMLLISDENEDLVISVKNYGNPILPKDQEVILQPFGRAKVGQQDYKVKGWGLGLAIVRSIVETFIGKLTLQSSAAEGTVFKIVIPLSTFSSIRV